MCVLTERGAMRVEPQFSDQSMIIPQGGSATLLEGQIVSLQSKASACSCEFPRAHLEPAKPGPPSRVQPDREISTLAAPQVPELKKAESAASPSASAGEPVYTVLMPPLSFDAKSPELPPAPAPETIQLVREVRLRPAVEFRGHVNPAPAQPSALPAEPSAPPPPPSVSQPPKSQPGFFDRVRSFFRRLAGANQRPGINTGHNG